MSRSEQRLPRRRPTGEGGLFAASCGRANQLSFPRVLDWQASTWCGNKRRRTPALARRASMAEFRLDRAQSVGCNPVLIALRRHPSGPDHLTGCMYRTDRVTGSGVVQPVASDNQVSIELRLTQCSAHRRRRLVHLWSSAAAANVPTASVLLKHLEFDSWEPVLAQRAAADEATTARLIGPLGSRRPSFLAEPGARRPKEAFGTSKITFFGHLFDRRPNHGFGSLHQRGVSPR